MGLFDAFKKKKEDVVVPPSPSDVAKDNNKDNVLDNVQNNLLNSPSGNHIPLPEIPKPSSNNVNNLSDQDTRYNSNNDSLVQTVQNINNNNTIRSDNHPNNITTNPGKNVLTKLDDVTLTNDKSKDENKSPKEPIPEPPKPIGINQVNNNGGQDNNNVPNFQDLLKKHDTSEKQDTLNQLDDTFGKDNDHLIGDELDDLDLDNLDLSIPEVSDDGDDKNEENSKDVVDNLDKQIDEEEDNVDMLFGSKKESEKKEEDTSKSKINYNIKYDPVNPDYDGPVFMELSNTKDIFDESQLSSNLIAKMNLHYETLFDKEKKTISKLRDNLEDIESKLMKIDRKIF